MAGASPAMASPLKRSLPSADSPTPSKKRRTRHRHRLEAPLDLQVHGLPVDDELCVDQLLSRSTATALNEAGFEQAEPAAMEGFKERVESYMLHFLSYVRQSMHACRRTKPLPHDFEYALRYNAVTTDSLRSHLKRRPSTSRQQPHLLPTPPPEEPDPKVDFPFLGTDLSGSVHRGALSYVPKHFPTFPSRHTYRETDVFTRREIDPRKVREQATEEGRLGEEALRKLTRAAKDNRTPMQKGTEKRLWGRSEENMETMFDKTLKAVLNRSSAPAQEDPAPIQADAHSVIPFELDLGLPPPSQPARQPKQSPAFEMGPIVNYDMVNWRRHTSSDVRKGGGRTAEAK